MRKSAMFAFLFAASVIWAQSEDPLKAKVTFTSKAMNAGRLIEDLGAKTGLKLMTNAQTEGEVLYVNVTDVEVGALLQKIADVASGSWREEEGGWRLIRPVGIANQESIAERVQRTNRIRKAIQDRLKKLQTPPKPAGGAKPGDAGDEEDDAGEMMFGAGMFGGSNATTKAITRLLAAISPETLATLGRQDRMVFASTPNRTQRPLLGNLNAIVTDLLTEHNRSVANRPERDPDDPEDKEVQEFLRAMGLDMEPGKAVNTRPTKVLLIASRGGGGMFGMMGGLMGGISLELVVYDAEGKVLLRGQDQLNDGSTGMLSGVMESIGIEDMEDLPTPGQPPKPKPQTSTDKDKAIEFSPITKELVTLFGDGGMMMMSGPPKMSDELQARLLRPDLHDPLSFAESESLDAVAKHKNLDIVANLPDSRLNFLSFFMGGQTAMVGQYFDRLGKDQNLKLVNENGWLTIKALYPSRAREERVDRPSLAQLVGVAKKKGLPSLDDYAAYAQKNNAPFETPAATFTLAMFAPGAISQGFMGMTDWNMIRFYGSLGQSQRDSLIRGNPMPFGSMTPYQRNLVTTMVFGPSHALQVGPVELPANDDPAFLGMFRTMMGSQSNSNWKQEPTEVMPNGLPNNGAVTLKADKMMIGKPEGAGDEDDMLSMFGALGPAELAFFEFLRNSPMMQQGGANAGLPQFNQMKVGSRRSYRFAFIVANDVSTRRTLNDDFVDPNAKPVSMDQLPDEFKQQIAKQLEALKTNPFMQMLMRMGRSQETVPPEPPASR